MSLAYRSLDPIFVQYVADVRMRRAADASAVESAKRVLARRYGRMVAGVAGVLGAFFAFLLGITSLFATPSRWSAMAATFTLLAAWPFAAIAGLVGWAFARIRERFAPHGRELEPGGAAAAWGELEVTDPLVRARSRAMHWELGSVAWPLAALSFLSPLTIHWLVAAMLLQTHTVVDDKLSDFGGWIGLSAVVVGHAHLVLAGCAVFWARSLRRRETHLMTTGVHTSWAVALALTTAAASVPFGIPGLFTVVTGLLFVPLMYVIAARVAARERLALDVI